MSQSDRGAGRILIVDDSSTVGMMVINAVSSVVDMPVYIKLQLLTQVYRMQRMEKR